MAKSDWKVNKPKSWEGFTRYQKVVLWAIGITIAYQIVFTILMILYPDVQLIWKAVLVFSSAISLAGAYVSLKGLWTIENYEQTLKKDIFEKYGIDVDDATKKNLASVFRENEESIVPALEKMDKAKFKLWINDFVDSINHYKSPPKREGWEDEFLESQTKGKGS